MQILSSDGFGLAQLPGRLGFWVGPSLFSALCLGQMPWPCPVVNPKRKLLSCRIHKDSFPGLPSVWHCLQGTSSLHCVCSSGSGCCSEYTCPVCTLSELTSHEEELANGQVWPSSYSDKCLYRHSGGHRRG